MKIIRNIKQMYSESYKARRANKSIGFVPTMGALHQGHASLIRKAVLDNEFNVVSVFVNPAQFSFREDFNRYPRNLKLDVLLCKKEGVDIIFAPDALEMYPENYKTSVLVEGLSSRLCGKSRPGHFKGVVSVVAKLFNIVDPDIAYFGQKDAQQAIIIKRLVEDLNIPVKIKVMPTIREEDGLALSSRNAYLSKGQRQEAIVLFHALYLAKDLIEAGLKDTDKIVYNMKKLILTREVPRIDYLAIVDPASLKPLKKITNSCLIAVAAWFGKTRLIDNIVIRKKTG